MKIKEQKRPSLFKLKKAGDQVFIYEMNENGKWRKSFQTPKDKKWAQQWVKSWNGEILKK